MFPYFYKMKLKIGNLILVCLGFYTLVDPLRMLTRKGYISFPNGIGGMKGLYFMSNSLTSFLIYSISIYVACYLWYERKEWWKILLGVFLGIFAGVSFRYLFDQVIALALFDSTNYRPDVDVGYYIQDQLYFAVLYFIVGFIFFVTSYSKHKDQLQQALTVQNQKMELSLLRAQINPHFLLNSMNNIYALVSMQSDRALDTIDKLSSILKYTLYENKEIVALSKEVDYLHNYIDLQKIRLDYEPFINIHIDQSVIDRKVPQFILVPLIENAFKHGNLKKEDKPLMIEIYQDQDKLCIRITNAIGKHQRDGVGGIGLENVQRRLTLLYPNNHKFETLKEDEVFKVSINIPIK